MSDALRIEAVIFGRYLTGQDPAPALVERYCQASHTLFAAAPDEPALAFARQHPWAIPMLDAAAGIRGADSLLRKKLLVMTAIVETTPALIDKTEQRAVGLPALALRIGIAGARTAFHVATGLALDAFVRRRAQA
ncbi:MAG TPA: hypothetical protein VK427_15215 [Kofleriaceae bacterium]|nr:hypothetical protein [Kofleriaceae bacterium]